jgi:hypothetical protein
MPTECSAESVDSGTMWCRCVEAAFDAGLVASDPGVLLLEATDRAIRMMDRFASCFNGVRHPQWIEHKDATLVGQPVPMMATLAGKRAARREDSAPGAGKSRTEPVGAEQISFAQHGACGCFDRDVFRIGRVGVMGGCWRDRLVVTAYRGGPPRIPKRVPSGDLRCKSGGFVGDGVVG